MTRQPEHRCFITSPETSLSAFFLPKKRNDWKTRSPATNIKMRGSTLQPRQSSPPRPPSKHVPTDRQPTATIYPGLSHTMVFYKSQAKKGRKKNKLTTKKKSSSKIEENIILFFFCASGQRVERISRMKMDCKKNKLE